MSIYNIDAAKVTSDTGFTEYAAGEEPWQKNLDGFRINQEGTERQEYQADFKKWNGFFRHVPDYKTAMLTFTDWVIGRDITFLDDKSKKEAERITGNGKQSFRSIVKSHFLTSVNIGDAITEIVRDKAGRIKNLMQRNPGTIKIVGNEQGRIIEYIQVSGMQSGTEVKKLDAVHPWQPKEIWHTMNNPICDAIHGTPESESMQDLIKSLEQIQKTHAVTLHRYSQPTYFFEANTDDDGEITRIQTKIDKAMSEFKNVVLPKGTLDEIKQAKVAQFSTFDPIPWMTFLSKKFNKVSRVPEVVQGESRESAVSGAEINFVGFKEFIIQRQISFAEDIRTQLGINVKFEEPREIQIEGLKGRPKDDKGSA